MITKRGPGEAMPSKCGPGARRRPGRGRLAIE